MNRKRNAEPEQIRPQTPRENEPAEGSKQDLPDSGDSVQDNEEETVDTDVEMSPVKCPRQKRFVDPAWENYNMVSPPKVPRTLFGGTLPGQITFPIFELEESDVIDFKNTFFESNEKFLFSRKTAYALFPFTFTADAFGGI